MKIVVCVKQVPDTAIKVKIAPNGKAVDLSDVSYVVNPYDEFAVEEALKIKEKSGAEVIAVSAGGDKATAGLRSCLALGVDRAILGTAAVKDKELVAGACRRFGKRIVVSLDAKDGLVVTHGWKEGTEVRALDLARELVSLGVERFVYTDIRRDGTLTEPNYAQLVELKRAVSVPIIASGGVARLEDLEKLKAIAPEAAIVGRALYTGDIRLTDAIQVAS